MKKFILGLALTMLLASPVAFASVEPIQGNGDPMQVCQAWGMSGYNTPTFEKGETIDVGFGLKETCPAWYPKHMKCFDLSGTEYWYNQLRALGFNI